MNRKTSSPPILCIDLKKSRIRIHRNTLHILGDPDYIQLLVNPQSKLIAIRACGKNDYLAHKVQNYQFENRKSYELYSRELLRTMLSVNCGWENNKIFRLYGMFDSHARVAQFSMTAPTDTQIENELEDDIYE